MTNRERLRQMDDAELAAYICSHFHANTCAECPGVDLCEWEKGRANGLRKWLQKEVEDDGE